MPDNKRTLEALIDHIATRLWEFNDTDDLAKRYVVTDTGCEYRGVRFVLPLNDGIFDEIFSVAIQRYEANRRQELILMRLDFQV